MHFEILVEDSSGKKLIAAIMPKIFADKKQLHSWRIISYKGIGKIPLNLNKQPNPANRFLLDQLPRLLRGYGKTYPDGANDTAVIVVLDCDRNNCRKLLSDMRQLLDQCTPKPNTLFRIAIEECESWILGDQNAIKEAYPKAKIAILDSYRQDSVCGTWEILADVVFPGGSKELARKQFFEIGKVKCDWADRIGPRINVELNKSYSFGKFRDGLRRLSANSSQGLQINY